MVAGYQSGRDTVLRISGRATSDRSSHVGPPASFHPIRFRGDLTGAVRGLWHAAASGLFPPRKAAAGCGHDGKSHLQTSLGFAGGDGHDLRPWAIRRLG
jgi:hypothetical protein